MGNRGQVVCMTCGVIAQENSGASVQQHLVSADDIH